MSVSDERVAVIGAQISVVDFDAAAKKLLDTVQARQSGYVCFVNAHTSVEAARDAAFAPVLNGSLLSLADGKPVHWVASRATDGRAGHLPGPDFMLQFLRRWPERGHYFYGSTQATLDLLVARLREQIPGLRVAGTFSPPYRALSDDDIAEHVARMREHAAEFIWVGLGAPKQEQFMHRVAQLLPGSVLLGVGAAFDFHAGTVQRAPEGWRRVGLEWLYRLLREPRRLWKRYLVTNTLFLAFAARQQFTRSDRFRGQPRR